MRDLASLAEKLGCSTTQLSIAWSLKHEPVQCLLIGATTAEQLHQNLQALQVKNDAEIYGAKFKSDLQHFLFVTASATTFDQCYA